MHEKISLETWKNTSLIAQYFERLYNTLYKGVADSQSKEIAVDIVLGENYGFLFKMKGILSELDRRIFKDYIVYKLKELGYQLSRSLPKVYHLQASPRLRVEGNQLFGNIKLIEQASEIQLLIYPYVDRNYNRTHDKREIIHHLFA